MGCLNEYLVNVMYLNFVLSKYIVLWSSIVMGILSETRTGTEPKKPGPKPDQKLQKPGTEPRSERVPEYFEYIKKILFLILIYIKYNL